MPLAVFLTWAFWPERFDPSVLPPDPPHDVRIVRDTWGIPHVFGATDADVAYGLAYAHAEDDFVTLQHALLAGRGQLAATLGREGAPNDYLVALLRIRETVDERYLTDLAPETRALCEGYAAGLNSYARLHPDEVLPGAFFPATGQDVIAGFVHKLPLFFGLHKRIQALLEERPPRDDTPPPGSNTFAVAPRRSADGHTRLAINSHQPWEGPVAWYEAHLKSAQGWEAYGGLFPGAPVILHGFTPRLGWAHTVNNPALLDVYDLETDPADRYRYKFDGQWRPLERRQARIVVKLLGRWRWTFTREVLWAEQGPVVRGPRGTFALRAVTLGEIRAVEQWYRMNRATTLDEWKAALRPLAVPMFNCGYADASGNIYYVYNARLPMRPPGFDWSRHLPGNSSAAIWKEWLPFERLPQVQNPAAGFIQNCNSSPFRTTIGPENPDATRYAPSLGIETQLTNRALRALELFGGDTSIDAQEFLTYKWDQAYSTRSNVARALRTLLAAPQPLDPSARRGLALLQAWDLRANAENRSAALALLALGPDSNDRVPAPSDIERRLTQGVRELEQHFGRLDPELQELQRLRRGTVDLGVGGAPDVLNATYARPAADGRRVGVAGDSLVLIVDWDRQGRVSAQAVQPYGAATNRPASPHYADQAQLFVERRLRPVWLDEDELRAVTEREYRPGEEAGSAAR